MPNKKSKQEFEIVMENSHAPDAKERLFQALSMLITEEDVFESNEPDKKSQRKIGGK